MVTPCGRGVADDLVVDVGDVHDPRDRVALPGEVAAQQVGEHEAPEVADVRRRVDRRTAAVHPTSPGLERLERLQGAAERVAEREAHPSHHPDERGGADGPPRALVARQVARRCLDRHGLRSRPRSSARMPAHALESRAAEAGPGAGMVRSSDTGRSRPRHARATTSRTQLAAVDAPGGRVAGREQPPEVAHARRGQQRVADRVERRVAVRVAVEAGRLGDLDAAQPQAVAGAEGMAVAAPGIPRRRRHGIVTHAGAGRAPTTSRSAGSVTLSAVASPGTVDDRTPRSAPAAPPRRRTTPVRAPRHRRRPAAARAGRPGASGPGRGRRPVGGRRRPPSATRLSESATGSTGMAAPWLDAASATASTSADVASGRAASWTRTTSASVARTPAGDRVLATRRHRPRPRRPAR